VEYKTKRSRRLARHYFCNTRLHGPI